jgi:hypothetical protein
MNFLLVIAMKDVFKSGFVLLVIVVEASAVRHSNDLGVGGEGAAVQGAPANHYRSTSVS